MSAIRAMGIAFWLFCCVSCCVFLYNDYFPEEAAQTDFKSASAGSCPLGYDSSSGEEPPANHPPIKKDSAVGGGESCPLGFGGELKMKSHKSISR